MNNNARHLDVNIEINEALLGCIHIKDKDDEESLISNGDGKNDEGALSGDNKRKGGT